MNNRKSLILFLGICAVGYESVLYANRRAVLQRRKDKRLLRKQHDMWLQSLEDRPLQTHIESQNSPLMRALQASHPVEKTPDIRSAVFTPTDAAPMVDNFLTKESERPTVPQTNLADDEAIEFHFEDADLSQLVNQIESLFNVKFIRDDVIEPLAKGARTIAGHKISFKTQNPLSKKEAWNLFITFLDVAGLTLVPHNQDRFYRITSIAQAQKSAIPAYIGVDFQALPDNDQLIRYMYFIQNTTVDTLKTILDALRSNSSSLLILQGIKAFILTDKAYNIKHLMNIVSELDQVTMPQSMSVLKLKHADAGDVEKLYKTLIQTDNRPISSRILAARKQPTALYFPENIRMIAEHRTNSLILLGSHQEIKRIEDFIIKYVDIDLDVPYSPLHVYDLQYANAATIADIMNRVTQFGRNTEVGKSGGVRGKDKYLKSMNFTAEPETNRIVVKGDYDDYLRASEIIKKLDEPQPQVVIEVLILSVQLKNTKELGTQLRTRENDGKTEGDSGGGLLGKNIKFQTSGLFRGSTPAGIVENNNGNGVTRLLGDLISLASGAGAGNTILTLGQDLVEGAKGVWGIVQALEMVSNTEVLSNPFVVATNKTKATVSLGETRRVVTSTIVTDNPVDTFGDFQANLEVSITPQINSDGMIILELEITLDSFLGAANPDNVAKSTRKLRTKTIVADKEVLALGGLIQNRAEQSASKTPLLGEVPILGWLFKNKRRVWDKNNLLILLSPRIIEPDTMQAAQDVTKEKIGEYHGVLDSIHDASQNRDPIHSFFFEDQGTDSDKIAESFLKNDESVQVERKSIAQIRREKRLQSETPHIKRLRSAHRFDHAAQAVATTQNIAQPFMINKKKPRESTQISPFVNKNVRVKRPSLQSFFQSESNTEVQA